MRLITQPVMKNAKNESLKSIVGTYMRKRQYCDNENVRKFELQLTKTAETCAISGIVEMEASSPNSIAYKCVNNDPVVAEAQFANLKTWIHDLKSKKAGQELKIILFPMLCHFYLEMLTGGHKAAASAFLMKHQSIGLEEGYELLEELATVENLKDLSEKKVLSHLRASRFHVALSSEAIHLLKQFLAKKAHVIVLQIVNSWFDVEELKSDNEHLLDFGDDNSISHPPNANGPEETPNALHLDNDVAKIEEIIAQVHEGPNYLSPLLIYTVSNPFESLTCAKCSDYWPLLACGLTSSEIRLWSLTDQKLPPRVNWRGSRVKLAIDDDTSFNQIPPNFLYDDDDDGDENFDSVNKTEDSVELLGHCGPVQDVAFVNNSEILVSASMDKTMRAWNLESSVCLAVYRGHGYPLWCLDTSPLARFVATGSYDRTARLWSLEFNYPLRIFAGHVQDVDCIKFHPNGNYLATGSSDSSVRLWSVDSGELVRVFEGHRGGIMSMAFSPDGNQIATGGDDRKIRIWDLRNCGVVGEFRGHENTILSLDWSSDGNFIASCSTDKTSRYWPVKSISDADQTGVKMYNLACNAVCSIRFSDRNNPICVIGVK